MDMFRNRRSNSRLRALLLPGLLAAGAALAACGGDNDFPTITDGPADPGGAPGTEAPPAAATDTVAPSEAKIVLPLPDAIVAIGDLLNTRVSARDNVALDSVVVQGFARGSTTPRYERAVRRYPNTETVAADTAQLALRPASGQTEGPVTLVATAFDRAGNQRSDSTMITLAAIRGTLIPLENTVDRIVDLVSANGRVYLSNFSRNRVEVLNVADDARTSFRVGSQPWGLALSPDSGTLYVANSGGTNVSVVDLRAGAPREDEARRIQTPDVQLFRVPFSRDSVEIMDGGVRRKVSAVIPGSVTEFGYSDRPQFIAQTASGELLYSTKPSSAATPGTIRRRRTDGTVEFFLDYVLRDQTGSLVIVNARDAALIEGDPNRLFVVTAEGLTLTGFVDVVDRELRDSGSKTYFDYFLNLEDLALRDTTFVAVSGNHQVVAFGEGAANPGRVVLYNDVSGVSTRRQTRDLVHNAAERVTGLAVNRDGSLGAARGQEAYFFNDALRLQGVGLTGSPTGGIAMHPDHAGYPNTPAASRLAFVSGQDDNGSPYIDVLDTFSFFRRQRVFLRQPVTGPIIAVRAPAGTNAALRLYAVTAAGVLRLDLTTADMQP